MTTHVRRRPRSVTFHLASLGMCCVLLLSACGETGSEGVTTTGASTSTISTTSTTAATTTTTSMPTSTSTTTTTTTMATTTTAPVTSTTAPVTTTTLPGEPFDGFARAGSRMGVVGVAYNDVLNLRSGPGVGFPILAELQPTAAGLVATGRGRLIPGAIWYELDSAGTVGWANSRYLAFIGGTEDLTSFVVGRNGGAVPTGTTMLDLGAAIADLVKSIDPASRVTVTVAPTLGDLGEVTYDVVGIGDDATIGMRLHVFGEPVGSGFSLFAVESTQLCGRGVSDGSCV